MISGGLLPCSPWPYGRPEARGHSSRRPGAQGAMADKTQGKPEKTEAA